MYQDRNMPPNNWNNGGYPPQNQQNGGYPRNAGQRLAQFNSPRNQMNSVIPGRVVNSLDDIMPDEVPMDGSLAVFPQVDLNRIYAKGWTDNGIVTVCYVPEQRLTEQASRPVTIPEAFQKEIFARLDAIEAALPKPKQVVKKEEQNNG